ncbi:hypothetical protein C0J52_14734 [Blattella germanica]|nr:hypothetical protein C0J52_14734 [Blattella germanica]
MDSPQDAVRGLFVRRSRIRGGHGFSVASAVVAGHCGGSGGGSPAPRGVGSRGGRLGSQAVSAAGSWGRSHAWGRSRRTHVWPSPPPRRCDGGRSAPPSPSPPPAARACHQPQRGAALHHSAGGGEVVDATDGRRPEQWPY